MYVCMLKVRKSTEATFKIWTEISVKKVSKNLSILYSILAIKGYIKFKYYLQGHDVQSFFYRRLRF